MHKENYRVYTALIQKKILPLIHKILIDNIEKLIILREMYFNNVALKYFHFRHKTKKDLCMAFKERLS